MMLDNVLIIAGESHELASNLAKRMYRVLTAKTLADARTLLSSHKVAAAVVDLDSVSFPDIAELNCDWGVDIVCVHRLADDRLWVNSLAAGALDCCYPDDHPRIMAVLQTVSRRARTGRAAA